MIEYFWWCYLAWPPTPVLLSLSSLVTASGGMLFCPSLLVRVNDSGTFFLGAWDSSTDGSFEAVLCACLCW